MNHFDVNDNNTYIANKRVKKKYLRSYLSKNPSFRKRERIATSVNIIGLVLAFLFLFIAIDNYSIFDGLLDFFAVIAGVIILLISVPEIIAGSIRSRAIREFGMPFCDREKECIEFFNDRVEYYFQDANNMYTYQMSVYSIAAEKINAININENILTIIGEGSLTYYDNFARNKINHELSQRRFYSNTPFSILLNFDNKDEIISKIKQLKC